MVVLVESFSRVTPDIQLPADVDAGKSLLRCSFVLKTVTIFIVDYVTLDSDIRFGLRNPLDSDFYNATNSVL